MTRGCEIPQHFRHFHCGIPSLLSASYSLLLVFSLFCWRECSAASGSFTVKDASDVLHKAGIDKAIPMSFVDYDGDRFTDIVYLNPDGLSLSIALMRKDSARQQHLVTVPGTNPIRAVIAGDFDGDSKVDLLILVKVDDAKSIYQVMLSYHPQSHSENMTEPVEITRVHNIPLALDYNADGLMDFLAEDSASFNTSVWLGQADRGDSMQRETLDRFSGKWGSPGYSNFVDAFSNFRPGIFLQMENGFQYFPNTDGKFGFSSPISVPYPDQAKVLGAPLFEDWYGKGTASMLLPYCIDDECYESRLAIYDFSAPNWVDVPIAWGDWRLVPSTKVPLSKRVVLPSLLPARAGDLNLNRFPDVVTVLGHRQNNNVRSAAVFFSEGGTAMNLQLLDQIPGNVSDLVIFDLNEDSLFDFVAMLERGEDSLPSLGMYQQGQDNSDNYFLKVMVLPGRCYSAVSCELSADQKLPYGLPVPGATLRYLTEGVQGDRVYGRAMISTTASHQALELPFHVFGLGNFANYIEDLTVAMPTNTPSTRQHDFNFIVPKTQVVIIPYPLDQPSKWKYLLFIDPFHDRKVIFVAVALLSVALLVVIIISILQFLEYREDKLEKLKEVQKFNFDAM